MKRSIIVSLMLGTVLLNTMVFSISVIPAKADVNHLVAVIFEQEWSGDLWSRFHVEAFEYVLDWYNLTDHIRWNRTSTPISSSELAKYKMVIYPIGEWVDLELSSDEETSLDNWVKNGGWFVTNTFVGSSPFWLNLLGLSSSPTETITNWTFRTSQSLYPYPHLWNNSILLDTRCSDSKVNSSMATSLATMIRGNNTFDALTMRVKGNGVAWNIAPDMAWFVGELEKIPNYFFTYIMNEFTVAQFGRRQSFFAPLMINFQIDDFICSAVQYAELQKIVNVAVAQKIKISLATIAIGMSSRDPAVWNLYRSNKKHLELIVHGWDHHQFEFRDASYSEVATTVSAMKNAFSSVNEGNATRFLVPPFLAIDDVGIKALGDGGYEAICGLWLHPDFDAPWSFRLTYRHGCAMFRRTDVFMADSERTFQENLEWVKEGTKRYLMLGIPIAPWLHMSDFDGDNGVNIISSYVQWLSSSNPIYVHFNELVRNYFMTQYEEGYENGQTVFSLPAGHTSFTAISFYSSTVKIDTTLIGENYIIYNQAFEIDKTNHWIHITQKQKQNSTTITLILWPNSTYIKKCNQQILSALFTNDLTFTLDAPFNETSITEVYSAQGKPAKVLVNDAERQEGEVWTYNSSNQLLAIWWTHSSSPAEVTVMWTAPPPPVEYTLTISSSVGGTTNPVPGTYVYQNGTQVTVTAIPDPGYNFDHWEMNGGNYTQNPITILMSKNYTLHAVFTGVSPSPEYTLTISSGTGGTTNPVPGTYVYQNGTQVNVTAIPNSGYNFDHWELNGGNYTQNPITILMTRNYTLHAAFKEAPLNLLPNPSTEIDNDNNGVPDYWYTWNDGVAGSFTWSSTAHSGARSLQLDLKQNSSAAPWLCISWQQVYVIDAVDCPFKIGKTYRLRAWYMTSSTKARISITFWDSNWNWIPDYTRWLIVESESSWRQSDWLTVTVPSKAYYIGVEFWVSLQDIYPGSASGWARADDFELYEVGG